MNTAAFQLPIDEPGRESHLAVRLSRPPAAAPKTSLVVLYLHGFGSQQQGTKAEFFRRRCLGSGVAFCSFDFQSHGESGGRFADLTLSRNLEDIGRVHGHLRAEGFERLVLFGSSMGGASAMWYAALHPRDIAAAIHIAPALELDKGLLERFTSSQRQRWQRDGVITFEHELVSCQLSWRLIEDLRSFGVQRLADLYSTPTLIFQGKNDLSVDWRTVLDLTSRCRAECISLHLMGDGDHRLLDRLPLLWQISEAFLQSSIGGNP